MLDYGWPGNVRELKNQIERLVLLGDDALVQRDDFARPSLVPPPSTRGSSTPAPAQSWEGPGGLTLRLPEDGVGLEEVERELIGHALQRFDGNVSQAARFLKVSRQTLIYRIKKHGLGG